MKFWKKAVSALLAAVTAATMMFAGSVTAGAVTTKTENSPYYVTYKESSEELTLTIYGFSKEDYDFLTDLDFSEEYAESITSAIRLSFDDIYFKNDYDYKSPNGSGCYFVSGDRYTLSLDGYVTGEFSGSLGYYNFYSKSGKFGKTEYIDLGASAKYRYAFRFVLDKSLLPASVLNHIRSSTNCQALACKTISFGGNEKGGVNADSTYIFGGCGEIEIGGYVHPKVEYAILPFCEDDGTLPFKAVTQKNISTLSFSEISNKAYTGESLKPSVTVKDGDKTLKQGTDYSLTYKKNKAIGTATITVTGKGDYSGTKTLTFQIVPKKTTLTAKRSGEKITLQWETVKGAEKYEIFYREKDTEEYYMQLATVSGSKTSYSTSKPDKNKTYQFKIRSYAESNGKKVYSKFSKVKTVTAK